MFIRDIRMARKVMEKAGLKMIAGKNGLRVNCAVTEDRLYTYRRPITIKNGISEYRWNNIQKAVMDKRSIQLPSIGNFSTYLDSSQATVSNPMEAVKDAVEKKATAKKKSAVKKESSKTIPRGWITTAEAIKDYGLSQPHLSKLCRKQIVKAVKLRGRAHNKWIIERASLEEYLNKFKEGREKHKNSLVPEGWVTTIEVMERYGLSRPRITHLGRAGVLVSKRMGTSSRSPRIYKLESVIDYFGRRDKKVVKKNLANKKVEKKSKSTDLEFAAIQKDLKELTGIVQCLVYGEKTIKDVISRIYETQTLVAGHMEDLQEEVLDTHIKVQKALEDLKKELQ